MTFLLLSMALVAATLTVIRPAMGGERPIPLIGFNGSHAAILVAGLAAIGLTMGMTQALALLGAYMIHEAGVVLGHRLAGHGEVRFRFLPIARTGPVSKDPHLSDLEAFFVTLMGPGLGIAPMVVAFALSDVFAGQPLQTTFGTIALTMGAFNFVALLPIWPLPGGKLARILLRTKFPHISPLPAASLLAGLIGMSWTMEAPLLFLVSLVGALAYVMQPPVPQDRPTLTGRELSLALTAYLFSLASVFLGGWWVLLLIAGRF